MERSMEVTFLSLDMESPGGAAYVLANPQAQPLTFDLGAWCARRQSPSLRSGDLQKQNKYQSIRHGHNLQI